MWGYGIENISFCGPILVKFVRPVRLNIFHGFRKIRFVGLILPLTSVTEIINPFYCHLLILSQEL